MPQRKIKKQELITREEWDFERLINIHDLNEHQIYFCWAYEFARYAPKILDAFDRDVEYRERTDPSLPWRAIVSLGFGDTQEPSDSFVEVIEAPPGFPSVPYLSVYKNHKIDPIESYKPFESSLAVQTATGKHSDTDMIHLRIEWFRSDKKITEAFKKWIKANRPHPPLENRGGNQQTVITADLKALGAYRLIDRFGAVEAAKKYTEDMGFPNGLYANLGEWSVAKARADKLIALWNVANIQLI